MAHVTFKGGVFPHKRKRFTREKALEEYRPKGDLVYPLRQHIGGTAVPGGDSGRPGAGRSASGEGQRRYFRAGTRIRVRYGEGHRARKTVSGKEILSIVVENDGQYERIPDPEIWPWQEMEASERLRRIRDAGVVGMGGAGFRHPYQAGSPQSQTHPLCAGERYRM